MTWNVALALAASYLLGAIPFGYLIYRSRSGRDIRQEGSGNIGATNVMRLAGRAAGLVTLLLDFGKGYLGVMLAAWATGHHGGPPHPAMTAAAVAVLLGHIFPVFLGFRGGKGVATGLGAFLALAPWAVLASLAVFAAVLAAWRFVSLGSVVAAALFPFAELAVYRPPPAETLGAAAAAMLIILRHSVNIRRLLSGSEPRLGQRQD